MAGSKRMGLTKLLSFTCGLNFVLSFNIETSSPLIFKDADKKSFFGYSIALNKLKKSLLVGAPLSKVSTGGAVFSCDITTQSCNILQGINKSLPNENNTAQWMGASVYSNNLDVLACAPRSLSVENTDDGLRSRLHGRCISIKLAFTDRSQDVLWKPCVNEYRKNPAYSACQVGFSAKYFGTGSSYNILSGLPNVLNSAGQLGIDFSAGQNLGLTNNSDIAFDDYVGYAATAGRIKLQEDNTTTIVIVGGGPRANLLRGQVFMYDITTPGFPLYISAINDPSEPEQTGTYFGSSIATADINGDRADDLIIGAPYYSGSKPNQGAVYVYINKGKAGMVKAQTLYSSICDPDNDKESRSGALFGHAIGSVGDLNRDGYFDIAIGAPWGGKDKKGIVCLFYGSQNEEPLQFKQKITADIEATLDGFGYSFAEFYPYKLDQVFSGSGINNDVDSNSYPDLAIGAYRSSQVVLLKSRPVASVAAQLDLGNTKQIDLLDTSVDMCLGADKTNYKCIPVVKICFMLSGIDIGNSSGDVNYTLEVDSDQSVGKRGFLFTGAMQKVYIIQSVENVQTTQPKCIQHQVFLVNNTKDIFRPLVVKLKWDYQPPADSRMCPKNLCPIANQMYNLITQAKVPYVKGCLDDGDPKCNADLSLTMNYRLDDGSKSISVGITTEVTLDLEIKNSKENAFMNKLEVVYPEQLTPNNVVIKDFAGTPIWDPNASQDKDEKTLVVTLNSPIGRDVTEKVSVVFGLLSVSKGTKSISLSAEAKTESEDNNLANNKAKLTIGVSLKANLTVSGNVLPEQIKWSKYQTDINAVGPTVMHTFFFQNKGPSSVDSSEILIKFPEKLDGQVLLNINKVTLEGESKSGSVGTCEHGVLNILKLNVKENAKNSTSVRKRRETSDVPDLNCGGTGVSCRDINCHLHFLQKNQGVSVVISSTLVEATFENHIKDSREIKVYAKFTSTAVEKPPNAPPDSLTVSLTVLSPYFTVEKKGDPVAWWIIFLCILAAILIIALIVFIMYKKGFFKRKSPPSDQKKNDDAGPGEDAALRNGDADD